MPDNTLTNEEITDSILYSIRKASGIHPEDTSFDVDLLLFINSNFSELNQLGVGPEEVFSIKDETSKWTDFIDTPEIEMVKAYLLLDVRIMFDPPASSTVLSAMEKKRDEYEWRLNVASDKLLYSAKEEE